MAQDVCLMAKEIGRDNDTTFKNRVLKSLNDIQALNNFDGIHEIYKQNFGRVISSDINAKMWKALYSLKSTIQTINSTSTSMTNNLIS